MSEMIQLTPTGSAVKSADPMKQRSGETKVAAYARVSTLSTEQEESYESQMRYFKGVINENPDWTLAGIYADQATGVNTTHRTDFNRMVDDGLKGKYDVLLVKSISRFARNVLTTIETIRELKAAGVVVKFQKEQISTDQPQMEFMLTIMASMAQQESESISLNTAMGFRYKHKDGRWSMRYDNFLGYDKDPEGTIKINPEGAETIRMIYDEFLDCTCLYDITQHLMAQGRLTGSGSTVWRKAGISSILRNEKYCGDVVLQKTVVEDLFTKKKVANTGQAPMYYKKDDHEGIVSRQMHLLAKGELLRRNDDEAEGPKPLRRRNDYTCKIICPICSSHHNRQKARNNYTWTCQKRASGQGCRAPIIDERKLNHATMQALRQLWDMHPEVTYEKVPHLRVDANDETLEAAATIYAGNQVKKRVADFLQKPRPEYYDSDTTWRLIESITLDGKRITYHFYGGFSVEIEADIYTRGFNGA